MAVLVLPAPDPEPFSDQPSALDIGLTLAAVAGGPFVAIMVPLVEGLLSLVSLDLSSFVGEAQRLSATSSAATKSALVLAAGAAGAVDELEAVPIAAKLLEAGIRLSEDELTAFGGAASDLSAALGVDFDDAANALVSVMATGKLKKLDRLGGAARATANSLREKGLNLTNMIKFGNRAGVVTETLAAVVRTVPRADSNLLRQLNRISVSIAKIVDKSVTLVTQAPEIEALLTAGAPLVKGIAESFRDTIKNLPPFQELATRALQTMWQTVTAIPFVQSQMIIQWAVALVRSLGSGVTADIDDVILKRAGQFDQVLTRARNEVQQILFDRGEDPSESFGRTAAESSAAVLGVVAAGLGGVKELIATVVAGPKGGGKSPRESMFDFAKRVAGGIADSAAEARENTIDTVLDAEVWLEDKLGATEAPQDLPPVLLTRTVAAAVTAATRDFVEGVVDLAERVLSGEIPGGFDFTVTGDDLLGIGNDTLDAIQLTAAEKLKKLIEDAERVNAGLMGLAGAAQNAATQIQAAITSITGDIDIVRRIFLVIQAGIAFVQAVISASQAVVAILAENIPAAVAFLIAAAAYIVAAVTALKLAAGGDPSGAPSIRPDTDLLDRDVGRRVVFIQVNVDGPLAQDNDVLIDAILSGVGARASGV